MTPTEMARVILANIDNTRALLEDGQTGYVLIAEDQMHALCQRRGQDIRRDALQSDDVSVFTTHTNAVVAQRYWNSLHPDDKVKIALRREALVAYIEIQQRAVDTLLALIEMERGVLNERPH
jgi:hypothetical protein